ncbi:MAG: hypothetical protein HLUCCA11_05680 [Phormidesmis priestleyi Ana]|uniref:Uncharacterized protein n=1 Tax=Phormidesmis priestleyi Ana TaxID=1666911 RepID=A0A0N8KNI8_9CYAN|nr:MAG: hypothetical protein HLUCCA11_05680 [Phormidesmis priestleyi Ana]
MPYKTTQEIVPKTGLDNPLLPAELEARIHHLENTANQGAGFSKTDWLYLWGLGVVVPALLLIWGWV